MEHEIIKIRDKSTNASVTRRAARISNYLAVARTGDDPDEFKVFRIKTGTTLLNGYFTDLDEAIKFAEWVNEIYADYFSIWDRYPQADIFSLVKWTVPEGLRFYEMIKLLRSYHSISLNEVYEIFSAVDIKKWKNEYIR